MDSSNKIIILEDIILNAWNRHHGVDVSGTSTMQQGPPKMTLIKTLGQPGAKKGKWSKLSLRKDPVANDLPIRNVNDMMDMYGIKAGASAMIASPSMSPTPSISNIEPSLTINLLSPSYSNVTTEGDDKLTHDTGMGRGKNMKTLKEAFENMPIEISDEEEEQGSRTKQSNRHHSSSSSRKRRASVEHGEAKQGGGVDKQDRILAYVIQFKENMRECAGLLENKKNQVAIEKDFINDKTIALVNRIEQLKRENERASEILGSINSSNDSDSDDSDGDSDINKGPKLIVERICDPL